jgi:hypothetical protein
MTDRLASYVLGLMGWSLGEQKRAAMSLPGKHRRAAVAGSAPSAEVPACRLQHRARSGSRKALNETDLGHWRQGLACD